MTLCKFKLRCYSFCSASPGFTFRVRMAQYNRGGCLSYTGMLRNSYLVVLQDILILNLQFEILFTLFIQLFNFEKFLGNRKYAARRPCSTKLFLEFSHDCESFLGPSGFHLFHPMIRSLFINFSHAKSLGSCHLLLLRLSKLSIRGPRVSLGSLPLCI